MMILGEHYDEYFGFSFDEPEYEVDEEPEDIPDIDI